MQRTAEPRPSRVEDWPLAVLMEMRGLGRVCWHARRQLSDSGTKVPRLIHSCGWLVILRGNASVSKPPVRRLRERAVTLVENVKIVHKQDACVVTLSGDLDEMTAPAVVAETVAAMADCPDKAQLVVVDLSALRFMGSAGIGALVDIRSAALGRGASVTLRGTPSNIARVLTIVGLAETFGLSRRHEEATPHQQGGG